MTGMSALSAGASTTCWGGNDGEVKIPTSKIREVLESSGYACTPDNIAAVRANIPLHTSDLILAALNATDLPDKWFALPLF